METVNFKFIDVWQDDHRSTIAYYENKPQSAWALGNIPHNSQFAFSRKDVPKIIKLLLMENSPLVRE